MKLAGQHANNALTREENSHNQHDVLRGNCGDGKITLQEFDNIKVQNILLTKRKVCSTFVLQMGGGTMAKEATLQVRMDADLKEKAEALYRELGTSFAEAVRIFAKQSVLENGMPFVISANHRNTYGRLSKYADPVKREQRKAHMRGQW